mgnify:CR=1 FL=1
MNILVAIHLANDPEVENQTLQVSHRGPFIGTAFGTTWSDLVEVLLLGSKRDLKLFFGINHVV